ncbi:MAG: Gfo/Idh/MocA family oxidoreductase [Proteobacteria bacterium]|nr:Gfo/Idh/MocA family oxidoreductase [Pseudomonadota bacterium]
MVSKVRIAIVGAGMMAREHIRNLRLFPGVEIVALADPVVVSIDKALKTIGDQETETRVHQTVEALVAEGGFDAVIVASPNFTHRAVLEALFETDAAILCEKPLCTTLEDARWAAHRAAGRAAPFWVGMEYRFMPPAQKFLDELNDGRVGRLRMLSIREHRFPFLPKVGDWNRFSENTGGTMVEKCCHFFDLMRLIVGSEPERVFCSGAMDVNHLDERYDGRTPDIIDNSFTVVDFKDGRRAMLDLCMFAEGAKNQEEIAAVGDKARLEVKIPEGALVFSPRTGLGKPKQVQTIVIPVEAKALKAGTHHGATFYQLQAFLAAVRGEGPVQVTADDGLRAVAMGLAAEISAREHRVVAMSELGF